MRRWRFVIGGRERFLLPVSLERDGRGKERIRGRLKVERCGERESPSMSGPGKAMAGIFSSSKTTTKQSQ
ncbi:MAG: hypothetical protein GX457_11605 [Thermotogaceae bacterium]|jgi:hypothetical protein|nr:hypothetical protein [Thermotogaceae bacterium]